MKNSDYIKFVTYFFIPDSKKIIIFIFINIVLGLCQKTKGLSSKM